MTWERERKTKGGGTKRVVRFRDNKGMGNIYLETHARKGVHVARGRDRRKRSIVLDESQYELWSHPAHRTS